MVFYHRDEYISVLDSHVDLRYSNNLSGKWVCGECLLTKALSRLNKPYTHLVSLITKPEDLDSSASIVS